MSKILRYLACLFMLIFAGNALAAGYSCPSYKKYTSCASGYYMTSSSSGRACNTSQNTGNACRPCSVYDDYKGVDTGTYYCAGDTSCPILSKVTITYNLNGGSGTKPANKLCTKGQTCTLNSGATTSFYRAGYVFKGWALTSTATSGFTSYTFTANDTVYAVWEECGIGEYKPGSGTQAAAACSSCPGLTPGFEYLPTTGNTSLTKCIQGIAKAANVNEYCATSSEATEQFDIQCQATSDGTWGDCAIGNAWRANPGSYVGIWKQTMPAEDVIENMCIQCTDGTYSEGGLINSCSSCPELNPMDEQAGWRVSSGGDGATSWNACYAYWERFPSNCASGSFKKNAISEIDYEQAWHELEPLTAKPGYKVQFEDGQTTAPACVACTDATFSPGGDVHSCSACPPGYDDNTETGKTSAAECQISCDDGTYVKTANAACTAVGSGYYKAAHMVNYGSTSTRDQCPSGYPNSDVGAAVITSCYSDTQSRPWSGSQVNGTTPTNCYSATWGNCRAEDMDACSYVAYSNSAGTDDGTVKSGCTSNSANCTRQVASVTAKSGYFDAGTTCSACPDGYPNSANGNEGGNTKCYASVSGGHYIGTKNSATQSECVGGTYKAAHTVYYGSTSSCAVCGANQYSDDGAASCTACKTSAGYGNSGTTAASHAGQASCKVTCGGGEYVPTAGGGCVAVGSGYYKTGTMTVAQNATNTTRSACSSLPGVSVSGGTYSSVSPYNASTTCRYKAPDKTITGCAAVTTATVAYSGSAWPATTYTVSASSGYYISGSGTASATCVGCEVGYACTGGTAAPDACDGQTQYQDAAKQTSCKTVSSGWYKVDNTKQAQCTGATYCTGGVKNNCPSGYTANTTAGKTAASSCQISCSGGTYVATAEAACTSVGTGYYRAAHTVPDTIVRHIL